MERRFTLENEARVMNMNVQRELDEKTARDRLLKLRPLLLGALIVLVALLGWQNYNFRQRERASLHQQLHNANFLILSGEVNLGLTLNSQTPAEHLDKATEFIARAGSVFRGAALLDSRYGDVWELANDSTSVAAGVLQRIRWFDPGDDQTIDSVHQEQISEIRALLTKLSAALPKWNDTSLIQNKWQIEAARDTAKDFIEKYRPLVPGGA